MNILVPDISIAEKVRRAAVVYTFLPVAFLLLIGQVLQNATIGEDDSLADRIIGAVTLLVLNVLVRRGRIVRAG